MNLKNGFVKDIKQVALIVITDKETKWSKNKDVNSKIREIIIFR